MTIKTILHSHESAVLTIGSNHSVKGAIQMLAERRIGAMPVVSGEALVGMFSERDVIYGVAEHGAAFFDHKVGDVMTSPAVTVSADTPVLDGLALMTRRRIRHLPVVEAGVLIGLVSIGDLVKHRIEEVEAEATAMRNYIQMA